MDSVDKVTVKKVAIIITAIVLLILTVFSVSFMFNLSSRDFSSKELVIRGTEAESIEGYSSKEVVGDLTVLKFESEDEARKAYMKNVFTGTSENLEVNSYLSTCNEVTEAKEYLEGDYEKTELRKYLDTVDISRGTVKVAVLDTGLTISDDNKSLFENRVIDTGLNLSTTGDKNSVKDDNGHGTSVASLIVANSNENVKVLPIKIASKEGKATLSSAYLGIKKAIELEADIINISMGTVESANSGILKEVIDEASSRGILVVVSAGNLGVDVRNFVPSNIESAIVVGAVNSDDTLAEYSNYGRTIDYVSYGSYSGAYGTSSATARVSGVLADALSRGVSLDTVNNYVEDLGNTGKDNKFGYGLLASEKLKTTDDYSFSSDYESGLLTVLRRKEMYNNLCTMDWKNMSDEELNKVLIDTDSDIIGLFLHTLSDTDLNLLVSKNTMLARPVEVTDAVVLRSREELVKVPETDNTASENYEKSYVYLLKRTEDLDVNLVYANSSGHFFLRFEGAPDAEDNGTLKISISNVVQPTEYNKQYTQADTGFEGFKVEVFVASSNDTSSASTTYKKGTINKFKIRTPYVVLQGDENIAWSGLYFSGSSFTKPAHTKVKDVLRENLNSGRLGFHNYATTASEITYSLDKSLVHKDTHEPANMECNAYNCGLAAPNEGSNFCNSTLVVKFERPEYKVTYRRNTKKKNHSSTVPKKCGTSITHGGISDDWKRTGYTFTGWNTKADGSGKNVAKGKKTTICSNLTLYAQWELAKYTVEYDLAGGKGEFDDQTKKHDKDLKLYTDIPKREGFTFKGWKSSADNKIYEAGGTYKLNKNTTMKAQWSKDKYTVTYNLNGGNDGGFKFNNQEKEHDKALTLYTGTPTKSGFTFTGWKSSSDNAFYVAGGTYTVNADTTMTAQWGTKLVRLDVNGLLGTLDSNGNNVYAEANNCSEFGTFDVYIDGVQVKDDVSDFAGYYPEGTTYRITDIKAFYSKEYEGYKDGADYHNANAAYKTSNDITGTITPTMQSPPSCFVRLKFKSLSMCFFNVDGLLGTLDASKNNVYTESVDCSGFGTFDVYINGVLDANDVSDYAKYILKGSTYKISDIKPLTGKTYDGYKHGANYSNASASYITTPADITGNLTSSTHTRLKFSTIPTYRLKVVYQKQDPDNLLGTISMETTETDFAQGSVANIDDIMDENTPDGYYLDTAKFGDIIINEDKILYVNYKLKTYKVNVDPDEGMYMYSGLKDESGEDVLYTTEIFTKDFLYGVTTPFCTGDENTYDAKLGCISQPIRVGYEFADWKIVGAEDSEAIEDEDDSGEASEGMVDTSNAEFVKGDKDKYAYFRACPLSDGDEVNIRAVWTPKTDIPYKVYHYVQRCTVSDYGTTIEYVLDKNASYEGRGTTGEYITPEVKTYNYHVSPEPQTQIIQGDGTTEIYYYYDLAEYNLTLDLNGGSTSKGVGPMNYKFTYSVPRMFCSSMTADASRINIPTRTGYKFEGWEIVSGGGNITQTSDYGYTNYNFDGNYAGDVTIKAKWSHVLTIDPNGGSMFGVIDSDGTKGWYTTPQTRKLYSDNKYQFASSGNYVDSITGHFQMLSKLKGDTLVPHKTGYVLSGWLVKSTNALLDSTNIRYEETSNGEKIIDYYYPSLLVGDDTVTAQWEPEEYIISLDTQGGTLSGGNCPGTLKELVEVYETKWGCTNTATTTNTYWEGDNPKTGIKVTRDGYTFGGFYTKTGGNGDLIVDKDGKIVVSNTYFTSNATIYVKWIPNTYNLTVNPDEGTIYYSDGNKTTSPFNIKFLYNEYRIIGTFNGSMYGFDSTVGKPVKRGYKFIEWDTVSDNGGVTEYFDNEGSDPFGYANDSFSGVTKPTDWGYYMFDGKSLGDATIKAKYTPNKYKIEFNYNNPCNHKECVLSGNNIEKKEVTFDAKIGDLPKPSKVGYTFLGWFTEKTGGTQYTSETIYNEFDKDITLYAHWRNNTYTIKFDKGKTDYSGTGVSDLKCTYDKDVTFPSHSPLLGRSYRIDFNSNRGTGSTVPQPKSSDTGNLSFQSWWIPSDWRDENKTYERPNFTSTDGGIVTAKAYWYGRTFDYSSKPLIVRNGYTFNGWYESDGTKTQEFTIFGDTTAFKKTLTAKWTPKQYKLNFDYNKPSVASAEVANNSTTYKAVTFDSAIGDLPKPTLEGWAFKGWKLVNATRWYGTSDDVAWNVVSTLKETLMIDKNYIWRTAGDLTAIAQWEPVTYSIQYKSGGGTVGKANPDIANDDVSLVVEPSYVYTVKYAYDDAYDYLPDSKKAGVTRGFPVLFTNYYQGSGAKTTSSLSGHTSYFDKRYIVSFNESPTYSTMTYLKDNSLECNYWDFSKWKCGGSDYIASGTEFSEGYNFGTSKTGKKRNLTSVDNGIITFSGVWKEEGITLPAVDLDLHRFLGWFTNSQVATGTPDSNGSLNFGDRGIYYGGGLTWNYDKLSINYTRSDGKTSIEEDLNLYAWWNKYPTYTDIYDGMFYEGQNITYSNLLQLVGSLDYEDDYYNTVKTQLEKLVVKEDNDVNDSDKNDGNIAESDVTTQEITSEEVQDLIKNIDTSRLTITIDKIKYKTGVVDTSGVSLSSYPNNYLNTSTSNIGDLIITFSVTDNGIIAGTDFDSEKITLTYDKACKIEYNNAPALSVSDVMLFTNDNTNKDNIGEYLISRQVAIDEEDLVDNIPWWCKNNAKTALNMDTARKLNDTIFIVNADNVTVNSAFENKYKEASDWLKSLTGLETIYGLKTSNTVHTFDGVSFKESELFEQITGMDVEFDCYDQFGKHASGNITPDNYKGGQVVEPVMPIPTPDGGGSGGSGNPTPTPDGGSGGSDNPTPTPDGGSGGSDSPTPTPNGGSGSGSGGSGSPTPTPNGGSGGSGNPTPTPDGGSGGSGSPTPTPNGGSGGSGSLTPTPTPDSGSLKSQPEDSRKIKVILINVKTDSTMLGANTATLARYISNGYMSTLDEDSYYSSVDGGRNVLLNAFDTGKKSNLNNISPSSTDVVYYNNGFTNSIGEDKVRVNINDYTK